MTDQKVYFETEEELQKAILKEKIKGTPDFEIGKKYGVTFRYIERLITLQALSNLVSRFLEYRETSCLDIPHCVSPNCPFA